jgi:apolipoprotein N-acyltransferase
VARWKAPLLAGTLDVRVYENPAERPLRLQYQNQDYEMFNAATLLVPDATHPANPSKVTWAGVHDKQKLMAFVERVPFVDRWPAMSNWLFDFGMGTGFGLRPDTNTFSFRDQRGHTVTVAPVVCYEQLFPATVAALVRNRADLIGNINNEGWWSQSHGAYQLAAFTRLRAIETRRAIARCSNNGPTCFVDALGRVYESVPWWREQTVIGKVNLSQELSLYVRYTDYFPKACVALTLLLGLIAFIQQLRSLVTGHWLLANDKGRGAEN